MGNSLASFIYGFISGFLVLLGTWVFWAQHHREMASQQEALRDLSHFGRPLRRRLHRRPPR
ncbi:MAG: hypothetical protein OZSIB_1329 [Candidatus Ozemobacter sibiricus]|jgi:high-affinity Fe2+/Pb2+ permease|uniref:Uncharacterized protein n=1 Tax=Candidatus Ozemobacter sibiricus TaxID=2268124 RepID=A0A367ZL77_9BACT|nr:MAG: hypothetical protein OZSIB_1329 [Candidatus Ozemobacter sibiricus]